MKQFYLIGFISCLLLTAFNACKTEQKVTQIGIKDLSWLEGQWQTEPRNRVEVWSLKGDKLQASGLLLKDKNPRVNELMTIVAKDGKLVYSVLAYGQNENKYVDFSLSNQKARDLIFANPDHDFPKTIRYTLQNEDQLLVTVSDGNEELSFTFFRSK
jgi:hypothetical protein